MASVAGMLKAKGYTVTGSDENVYPPMSIFLESLDIPVRIGYRADNLQPRPDIVVVGNAISRGNPELEHMLNEKIRYVSMSEVIKEQFIRGRHSIVIAGTHGKTTTTSLVAWVLEVGGLNPSFLIGGVAENFGSSFRRADSNYFVIEGDEYDTAYFDKGPKFMHYLPDTAILNNVEFDHGDIYPDIEAVKTAFRRFVNLIPQKGRLIAGVDSPIVRELASQAFCPVESFSVGGEGKWTAHKIELNQEMTHFTVFCQGVEYGRFVTPLVGNFNIRNCLAAIAAADSLGIAKDAIKEALTSFKSVKRRMQVRGVVGGVTVIDDFAHHPTAVRETLEAARQKYNGQRIVAVFEPRSWTARSKVFQKEFESSFESADYIIIAPVFHSHRLRAEDELQIDKLVEVLRAGGKEAHAIGGADAIVEHLSQQLRRGDVVVIMSNGGFDRIHEKMLKALEAVMRNA